MVTKVLTANIKDTLPDAIAKADVKHLLREANADLGGLQEWNAVRDHLFQAARDELGSHPGGWARGPHGGGPGFWNRLRYEQRTVKSIRLARGELVGHLPGRRDRLGPSWATEIVLDDLGYNSNPDGSQTVLLVFHLTAEVQKGAGYRKDLAHRLRVMRHKREKRRLGRRARFHQRRGRKVYALGDSNYDGMQLGGLKNCWDGYDGATLGPRAVDIVFSTSKPMSKPSTITTHSDHKAVVVTYGR